MNHNILVRRIYTIIKILRSSNYVERCQETLIVKTNDIIKQPNFLRDRNV